jgi:hypothetical protein
VNNVGVSRELGAQKLRQLGDVAGDPSCRFLKRPRGAL